MSKLKNKRNSGLADKVQNKKRKDNKKLNPFEVHINKEKLKILGQKRKHDRGLPGVSRAKAIQKRKETLGTEMKLLNKTNTFIDRRIGEKNNDLSAEDRMIARFTAERAKQHSKKNIYNLADDEVLTHRGQTLEQIEKFDDPRSSDEEDEDGRKLGGLDDEFVSEGHFGGGMLSKIEKDGAKSHKDLIEQLIAESKKRKAEKQKEKEQTLDLTERLDNEWKDLQPVVLKKARVEKVSLIDKLLSEAEAKGQDYDKMMRELRFEKRGTPSDGLKTEEKQQKEEKVKLDQLEKERQKRMFGEDDEFAPKIKLADKHRSADDLDHNFDLDNEQEFMLAYDKDGKPLLPEHIMKANHVPNAQNKSSDSVSDFVLEDNENEDENQYTDTNSSKEENGLTDDKSENDIMENEISVSDIEENVKDLEDTTIKKTKIEVGGLFQSENSHEDTDNDDDDNKDNSDVQQKTVDDLKNLKESEQESDEIDNLEGSKDLGNFFAIKSDEGDNLRELLSGKSPAQQSASLQKLIKSYDPSLAESNKEKLARLFAHMLQYVNDIFTNLTEEYEVVKSFLVFDKLVPHFYDLGHTSKVPTKKFMVELLKEKYDIYKKNPKKIPDLDTLIFFKLISLLYPTSDFRHPVTTPALVFMSEILTFSKFKDAYSISRGLFISSIILEYTVLSKRYVPSAINFLRGILYLSSNTNILNPIQVVPPFRLHKDVKILNLEKSCSKMYVGTKMAAKDLILDVIDDSFKIRSLLTCVQILKEFFDFFNDIEAQEYLFTPLIKLFDRIDIDMYPERVANTVLDILKYMKESLEVKTFTPLTKEKKKPKALRMYEPDVQEVFTGSKGSKLSREQARSDRLKHKYKKEMKGALREIRRDKSYIASVKIRQKIHSDNIRKEKVKQIYKDAAIQQGELNKLKRKK